MNGAERGYGGDGNDKLVSVSEGSTKDGADIFSGGAGADTFVFGFNHGHDLITDFKASEGDKLLFKGLTSGSAEKYIFARVNFNGGHDDLVVFKADGSGNPDFNNFVLLRDFFTTNSGVLDVSKYENKIYNATDLNGLGVNNIVQFDIPV